MGGGGQLRRRTLRRDFGRGRGNVAVRIGDVDVKVREAALDSLRTNVNDYAMDLSGDMRVDILRTGLTKR